MALSVAQMIQALLGVNTFSRNNPVTASVGAAAALVARGAPQRAFLLIVNLSVNSVYVGPFADVAAAKGILLQPNGGSVSLIWDRDLELVTQPWYAIAPAGASAILVVESVIGD